MSRIRALAAGTAASLIALAATSLAGIAAQAAVAADATPSVAAQSANAAAAEASAAGPVFLPDGRLRFPEHYREWVFLSSGIDMSYRKDAGASMHSMFDNVFVDPTAYREFLRTGTWPDGTVLVLELRAAAEKGSINRHGKFQTGDVMGLEVHVKDARHFNAARGFVGGWAFFGFRGRTPGTLIPTSADCYSCHRQHGAVDTTFVQFYPTLLEVAERKGTLVKGR
ncbi:MAG: cytochrome P460 family protein [Steroidobacteraceae bacterium]